MQRREKHWGRQINNLEKITQNCVNIQFVYCFIDLIVIKYVFVFQDFVKLINNKKLVETENDVESRTN